MKYINHTYLKICLTGIAAAFSLPALAVVPDATGLVGNALPIYAFVSNTIAATSMSLGLAFLGSACLKFKYHRDNPLAMPLGQPVTLLALSLVLIIFTAFIFISETRVYGENGGKMNVFDSLLFENKNSAPAKNEHKLFERRQPQTPPEGKEPHFSLDTPYL